MEAARLVGIAYAGSQKDEAENLLDFCLLLDSQGNVWTVGFTKEGDDILRTAPQKLTNLGFTTEENWYFSSIATDGAYLYASLWSGEQTDLVALDLNSGAVANLGNFGADVWPVVGLEVQAGATATAERLVRAMEASVMTAPSSRNGDAAGAPHREWMKGWHVTCSNEFFLAAGLGSAPGHDRKRLGCRIEACCFPDRDHAESKRASQYD